MSTMDKAGGARASLMAIDPGYMSSERLPTADNIGCCGRTMLQLKKDQSLSAWRAGSEAATQGHAGCALHNSRGALRLAHRSRCLLPGALPRSVLVGRQQNASERALVWGSGNLASRFPLPPRSEDQ